MENQAAKTVTANMLAMLSAKRAPKLQFFIFITS